ncbi:hypothetical protein DL98DRAFT_282826 [Cadophora sp. DSE1049]|nr:hypothetical protein DL98DRAFT_282826 [Cadophora sp. DSE1049]
MHLGQYEEKKIIIPINSCLCSVMLSRTLPSCRHIITVHCHFAFKAKGFCKPAFRFRFYCVQVSIHSFIHPSIYDEHSKRREQTRTPLQRKENSAIPSQNETRKTLRSIMRGVSKWTTIPKARRRRTQARTLCTQKQESNKAETLPNQPPSNPNESPNVSKSCLSERLVFDGWWCQSRVFRYRVEGMVCECFTRACGTVKIVRSA